MEFVAENQVRHQAAAHLVLEATGEAEVLEALPFPGQAGEKRMEGGLGAAVADRKPIVGLRLRRQAGGEQNRRQKRDSRTDHARERHEAQRIRIQISSSIILRMQYVMSRPRALTAPSIPTLALFLLSVLAGCGGEEAAQPSEKVGGADGVDEAVRDEADGPEDPNEHTHEGNEDLARILTTDALHDFGQVWQGSVVAHEFEFTAGGAVDLSILDYKPDCGCTVAHLEMINEDGVALAV